MTCSARGCRKNKKCQRCVRQTNKNTYDMENAEIFRSLAFIGEDRKRRYRNWLKTLRIGSAVAVCYDGKEGRARAGIVERVLGKGTVWVRFSTKGRELCVKFIRGEGWDTSDEQIGIMRMLGLRGDFYSLKSADVQERNANN